MVRKVTLSVKIQAKVNFEGMGAKPLIWRGNTIPYAPRNSASVLLSFEMINGSADDANIKTLKQSWNFLYQLHETTKIEAFPTRYLNTDTQKGQIEFLPIKSPYDSPRRQSFLINLTDKDGNLGVVPPMKQHDMFSELIDKAGTSYFMSSANSKNIYLG